MKLSREPVVWRTALAGIVAALVTLGVLAQPAADQIGGGLDALLVAVNALLPIVAGLLAKQRTSPVAAGTPAGIKVLVLGADGVYRAVTAEADPEPRGYTATQPEAGWSA